ncbi:hypothetical protein GCM10023170_083300 [Phytohabitans houttuyneae]|uniref:carboxypeptidase regulatory-like domain-containing protein n=1 Tax=Phytohabitans houttuyneae TaxID=1076126 RepID=UPI0031EF823A
MTDEPRSGPTEAATTELAAWIESVTGGAVLIGATTTRSRRADGGDGDALRLWPLELRPERHTRGADGEAPYTLRVRHLLAPAEPPSGTASSRLLDAVLVAAVRAGEPAIALEPPDPRMWLALGVEPRPALFIDVPAQVVRQPVRAPLVLHPLRLGSLEMRPLDGRVLGPGERPIPGMRVEAGRAAAYTDADGWFHLAAVPRHGRIQLRLEGRGRALTARLEPDFTEPLTIHCDLEES